MSYTVLIVDDSEIIRAALERTLKLSKVPVIQIFTACDGVDGLEKLKNNWIDIVLTDINMPKMSGIEMFEQMQSHNDLKDIPVVVVSTEGSSVRIDDLRSKGIRGYIRKPFTPENVRNVIMQIMEDDND